MSFWTGKAVLITGASSGLGAALMEALAPHRLHLGLLARRDDEIRRLAGPLSGSGSQFWIRACDVRDRVAVEGAVRDFAYAAGALDVVWVNSGIGGETSRERWDWDLVEAMIDTNLKGALYTTRAALELMAPRRSGRLVAISSAAAMRGLPARGVYGATKVALAYYFESLALEYPELGFTTIFPGFVDTPINRGTPNRLFLMGADRAARIMMGAVERGERVLIYPWQIRALFHLARSLPFPWYRAAARRTATKRTNSLDGR